MVENLLPRRSSIHRLLEGRTDNLLIVAGLGSAIWDAESAGENPLNFYLLGAMGSVLPTALGLALAQPKRRVMALMGAEVLFYPTAIGSEPYDDALDTSRMWRRAMQGHAVSNCMPVIAANRIGTEEGQKFYGHSFIADEWGDLAEQFGAEESGVLVAVLDLERAARHRAGMGFFRDRRPQLYGRIAQDI